MSDGGRPSTTEPSRQAAGPGDRSRTTPDASGYIAGMMIIASILVFAGIGALLGLAVGAVAPLALAAAPIGLVVGFYAVWVRFFKQR